ncbi:MAG: PAS domain-containing protein, partial [Alphaproteobacteria bacterium]|nr:PAS domain-containing protein [Alphaproteobacteria bacterium]
ESEARLVNAQRIARLGNWERNLETGELHWSDQVYDIFAITPEQFAGTHEAFLERVHPDDRELVEVAARRALDGKAPLDIEFRIVRPDTSERVIHSQGEVEFDAAGKPVRLHGTAQDITERKKAEQEIAGKSALLETIFENMSQGISVYDADLKLTAFNQRYIELRGYPPGFIHLGMPLEEIVRFKCQTRRVRTRRCRGAGQGTYLIHSARQAGQVRARRGGRKNRRLPPRTDAWRRIGDDLYRHHRAQAGGAGDRREIGVVEYDVRKHGPGARRLRHRL